MLKLLQLLPEELAGHLAVLTDDPRAVEALRGSYVVVASSFSELAERLPLTAVIQYYATLDEASALEQSVALQPGPHLDEVYSPNLAGLQFSFFLNRLLANIRQVKVGALDDADLVQTGRLAEYL